MGKPSCSGHGHPVAKQDGTCECVCDPGSFGLGCCSPVCLAEHIHLSDREGAIVTHSNATHNYRDSATCVWEITASDSFAAESARKAARGGGRSAIQGVLIMVDAVNMEPESDDAVTIYGRDDDEDAWSAFAVVSDTPSECVNNLDCSGDARGKCVFAASGDATGRCVCLPQFRGGGCSVPASYLVPYPYVRVAFSSDINNRHMVYDGPILRYVVQYWCPGNCRWGLSLGRLVLVLPLWLSVRLCVSQRIWLGFHDHPCHRLFS